MRQSEILFGDGKLKEAESLLLRAVLAAVAFKRPDLRLAETQHRLGIVYTDLGRLPEAEKWYRRSLSIWKASVGKHNSRLPKPLISLASLFLENGLGDKAERLVDPWLSDPEFRLDPTDLPSVSIFHNIAALKFTE